MDWKYLDTDAFRTRQVLAAHYVADCACVYEIGSHHNPISGFLRGPHDYVICADPNIPEEICGYSGDYKRNGRLVARRMNLYKGAADEVCPLNLEDCGLVVLGYDPSGLDLGFFLNVIEKCQVAVLEGWEGFGPWQALRQKLSFTGKKIAVHIKMDLSGNDFGDMSDSYPPRCNRELIVLK